MKTFLFTTLVLFSLSFYAQDDIGEITIVSPDKDILVSINGVRMSTKYNSTVECEGLEDYNYTLKVWTKGSYSSKSFNVKNTPNYRTVYVYQKDNYGSYTLNLKGKQKLSDCSNSSDEVWTNSTNNVKTITDSDFGDILATIRKESFDNTKLSMAKSILSDSYITSAQLKQIIKLFSFDDSKVEMAKYGHALVTDKHNFYKVYDAFSFSSSKDDVMEYIKGK